MKFHDFARFSDSEIYNISQTDEEVHDGDVFLMPGKRVAIMLEAWPTMVVGDSKELHRLEGSWYDVDDGKYKDSFLAAMDLYYTITKNEHNFFVTFVPGYGSMACVVYYNTSEAPEDAHNWPSGMGRNLFDALEDFGRHNPGLI